MTSAPPAFSRDSAAGGHAVSSALSTLERALAGQRFSRGDLVVLGAAAAVVPTEPLVAQVVSGPLVFFAEPTGREMVGFGVARELRADGDQRFVAIQSGAEAVFTRLRSPCAPAAPRMRLFGGFSFQVGRARGPLWQDFGEARFVLPRLLYQRDANAAELSLIVPGEVLEDENGRSRALLELARALAGLEAQSSDRAGAPEPWHHAIPDAQVFGEAGPSERRGFVTHVEAVRDHIAQGRFSKVVVARRAVLEAPPPALHMVLGRLREEAPESTRFAFRFDAGTFVGATPERLIRKSGLDFESEALAGSIRLEGRASSEALLKSEKNLREHEIVLRAVVEALRQNASELSFSKQPEVRTLRHILHLWTRIRGRLQRPEHVLELVHRLHPTPAVGGEPKARALEWIWRHEPDERGWYGAPIGWFDRAGDGDFLVALRSALLESRRAHLYVGSGIVSDSDPDDEFQETRLKLVTMLRALGALP